MYKSASLALLLFNNPPFTSLLRVQSTSFEMSNDFLGGVQIVWLDSFLLFFLRYERQVVAEKVTKYIFLKSID